MATREEIKSEVEKVPEERLDELYRVVRTFSQEKTSNSKQSLLARLRKIQIEGPEDLASNFDLYLNGEKSID
ncbi:MAG TPA: hypothetical protein VFA21_19075 [Pyrinomonadaceae bacterium]|nr:hypothetical protein [Pyrinomonadaceae bacterium]